MIWLTSQLVNFFYAEAETTTLAASGDKTMRERPAEFGNDEVRVCVALALCIAGASIDVIYRLLG